MLLPENQIEVIYLIQRWSQLHTTPLKIKSRIPSWSLIADLCATSMEVGFLPDFLAYKVGLYPVPWQPPLSTYRLLALHRPVDTLFHQRLNTLINVCREGLALRR